MFMTGALPENLKVCFRFLLGDLTNLGRSWVIHYPPPFQKKEKKVSQLPPDPAF